jgi:hydroxymethylpyrimidine/phosphomethylpyrimidine kinase
MPNALHTPRALTIAGSDSGGGAGIQADLKAFARCGVHGMSVITAITAQNTLGVSAVQAITPEIILAQVRAVLADIGVDAVKVGMIGTVEAVHAVAEALDLLPEGVPVVVDPVMVSESGAQLLDAEAQDVLVEEILPRATILTPNVPEARVLAAYSKQDRQARRDAAIQDAKLEGTKLEGGAVTGGGGATGGGAVREAGAVTEGGTVTVGGGAVDDEQDLAFELARAVLSLGPKIVVLTGGHRAQAVDLFLAGGKDAEQFVSIPGERHPDGAAHGSGCTHSAVLAAQLALGREPLQAAFAARALAGEAVAQGLRDIGEGPGPVDILGLARLRSGSASD